MLAEISRNKSKIRNLQPSAPLPQRNAQTKRLLVSFDRFALHRPWSEFKHLKAHSIRIINTRVRRSAADRGRLGHGDAAFSQLRHGFAHVFGLETNVIDPDGRSALAWAQDSSHC